MKFRLATASVFASSVILASLAQPVLAFSPPNLSNLSSNQVDAVFKDFGSSFIFRPLEPASDYGKVAGVSFGIIGSLGDSSDIRNNISGTNGLSYVPNAQIFLGFQAPLGLAGEVGFLPTVSVGGFKMHSAAGDLKWTINDVMGERDSLPFDLAFRAMYGSSGLSYAQTVSGVNDVVSYSTSSYGTNLSVSKKFAVVEPYVGLGYIHTSSTLSDTGSVTLFQNSVTSSDSFSGTNSGLWFYGGVQVSLLFPTLTAEYDNTYGVGSGAVKFAFKF